MHVKAVGEIEPRWAFTVTGENICFRLLKHLRFLTHIYEIFVCIFTASQNQQLYFFSDSNQTFLQTFFVHQEKHKSPNNADHLDIIWKI